MRLLSVLAVLSLAACSTPAAEQPTATPDQGLCAVPLRTLADVRACHGDAQYVSEEDTSVPGTVRIVWRYILEDASPPAIVQALGALALKKIAEGDEVTVFLFGSTDFSLGYNRGQVVITGQAGSYTGAFDVCTTITTETDSLGTFQTGVEKAHFSAPLN